MDKGTQTNLTLYDEIELLNEKVSICFKILNRIQSNSFYVQNKYVTDQLIRTIRQNLQFPEEVLASASSCNSTLD